MSDAPRNSRQLTQDEIRDIITSNERGESHGSIAKRLQCDRSTVSYHLSKHFAQDDGIDHVYAVIAVKAMVTVKRPCQHPSLKCLVCGTPQDNIRRAELEEIARLTRELASANDTLKRHGLYVERAAV